MALNHAAPTQIIAGRSFAKINARDFRLGRHRLVHYLDGRPVKREAWEAAKAQAEAVAQVLTETGIA